MNLRAIVAIGALAASLLIVSARAAVASCNPTVIYAPAKSALRAATAVTVRSGSDSEHQYQLLLTARSALDAASTTLQQACAGDDFDTMIAAESGAVYRAWNESLAAGRALFLAGQHAECRAGLHTVAAANLLSGWQRLNRLFRERPLPDSYATVHQLALARAKDVHLTLPPLNHGNAIASAKNSYGRKAFSAGMSLAPYCSRY